MRMTIERMELTNFKGCRHLDVHFDAKRTEIRGANGTGKTTIADAFTWVLFNKNSHGDAPGSDNFREKPLDENGNEVHNLDTTVELNCLLDGQRFDLKRTQSENWVKKRGNAEATFQGNVSTYWINGVETKLTDFKQRIAAIADEEVFRLVGSLSAFNGLEWKKRRSQLLTLSGEDVDGNLLARDEYRPLADECGQRNVTPDELKKVLNDQKKRLNDELKMLPVRIDEARKSAPTLTAQQIKDAEYIIADSNNDIARIDETIVNIKAGGHAGPTQQQKLALDQEIVSIKRRMWDELASEKKIAQAEADAASEALRRFTLEIQRAKTYEATYQEKADRAIKRCEDLRAKFIAVRGRVFDASSTICPTCGQQMPAAMIEQAKAKFEANRRAEMEDIKRDGMEAKQVAEQAQADHDKQVGELAHLEDLVKDVQESHMAAMQKVRDLPVSPDFDGDSRLQELQAQRNAMEAEGAGSSAELDGYERRKRDLQEIVNRNQAVLAQHAVSVENEKRIKAYEARQQEVGAQLTETEQLMILLDRFVQDRCSALEDGINSRFPTVRWKLFDRQINGGIVDTCMCMIPCDSGLVAYESANTAAQINADIEIVNVLSEYYDVEVPLFVDNAERVVALAQTETQLITLAVSMDDELNIDEKGE